MGSAPKLLDRVREAIRLRHYSRRTEEAYVQWIRRFILFHGKAHPSTMGAQEIEGFLAWLAVEQQVSASTQSQALSAILFLYRLHEQDLAAGCGRVVLPHLPALLRDASAGVRVRHSHCAGAAGTCGREYDDDLHACPPPRGAGGAESGGRVVTRDRRWPRRVAANRDRVANASPQQLVTTAVAGHPCGGAGR
jgi:hypothetical protein